MKRWGGQGLNRNQYHGRATPRYYSRRGTGHVVEAKPGCCSMMAATLISILLDQILPSKLTLGHFI